MIGFGIIEIKYVNDPDPTHETAQKNTCYRSNKTVVKNTEIIEVSNCTCLKEGDELTMEVDLKEGRIRWKVEDRAITSENS